MSLQRERERKRDRERNNDKVKPDKTDICGVAPVWPNDFSLS